MRPRLAQRRRREQRQRQREPVAFFAHYTDAVGILPDTGSCGVARNTIEGI